MVMELHRILLSFPSAWLKLFFNHCLCGGLFQDCFPATPFKKMWVNYVTDSWHRRLHLHSRLSAQGKGEVELTLVLYCIVSVQPLGAYMNQGLINLPSLFHLEEDLNCVAGLKQNLSGFKSQCHFTFLVANRPPHYQKNDTCVKKLSLRCHALWGKSPSSPTSSLLCQFTLDSRLKPSKNCTVCFPPFFQTPSQENSSHLEMHQLLHVKVIDIQLNPMLPVRLGEQQ